jgi:hypothetical protein
MHASPCTPTDAKVGGGGRLSGGAVGRLGELTKPPGGKGGADRGLGGLLGRGPLGSGVNGDNGGGGKGVGLRGGVTRGVGGGGDGGGGSGGGGNGGGGLGGDGEEDPNVPF